ncbi:hypothetical protein [Corynebacterium terpenotabidum]|uniref:Low molecular weight antigen MTB12-like C-terminal domain-containing protein n=1 Tax=Corynebacterium terpenotabidum Y-11 TaxID=1200352 RepID=S4XJJ3_9CORY|nr:hypothetical protein [Corynebacterium terpenotabidum]AGP31920.1 hypothetical protein A606_11405 [Corynebacterium terpenotabidum Y-11]
MPGSAPPPTVDRRTILLSVLLSTLATSLVIALGIIALNSGDTGNQIVSLSPSAAGDAPADRSSTATSSATATASSRTTASTTSTGTPGGTGSGTGAASTTEPSSGTSTTTVPTPTASELGEIVHLLTATDASDEEKSRYIEASDALIVPQTVSRIGLFRAPRGGSEVTGPVERDGDTVTAQLHAWSQGIPDVSMPIQFVYRDGTWRLSSSSICSGVRTVGLPIYCNA